MAGREMVRYFDRTIIRDLSLRDFSFRTPEVTNLRNLVRVCV
jgi:hypothetical protein